MALYFLAFYNRIYTNSKISESFKLEKCKKKFKVKNDMVYCLRSSKIQVI